MVDKPVGQTPSQVEVPRVPESEGERRVEKETGESGKKRERGEAPASSEEKKGASIVSIPASQPPTVVAEKSELRQQIERILEEDLDDLYRALSAADRAKFRTTGDAVAGKIERALQKVKITVLEIIKLIRGWLSVLPGVNRFFIEQESKIKAEQIIKLKTHADGDD